MYTCLLRNNKGKARPATPEKEVEQVSDSPERPSAPLSRKRTNTLVESTPVRGPPALQSAPEPSQPASPPPSTAPARLYKGREEGSGQGQSRAQNQRPGASWQNLSNQGTGEAQNLGLFYLSVL